MESGDRISLDAPHPGCADRDRYRGGLPAPGERGDARLAVHGEERSEHDLGVLGGNHREDGHRIPGSLLQGRLCGVDGPDHVRDRRRGEKPLPDRADARRGVGFVKDPAVRIQVLIRGTRNVLYEPAMSEAEYNQAILTGCDLVDDCIAEGCKVICIGEMGIANTSPSSIWMHLFGNIPLKDCIGAGAGLDTPGIRHKYEVLSKAVERFKAGNYEPLAYFGGFEMTAAIGAMLKAAEKHLVILVDGFIMTACALAAIQLYPAAKDYMIFTHCGDESGHKLMLDAIGVKPLLHLGLRLGEGTGALCAFPIVDSAVRMINEMNNFDNANITKYF